MGGSGELAFEIPAFPSYPTKAWLGLVLILAVSPHTTKSLSVCRKGVFVGSHPRAWFYFYICILHGNRDFMHRIKRFPPISLGLSFC